MLCEVFYWVFNMSILGSFVGTILLLLRPVKKIPRFAVYVLWSVVLFRFAVPVGISSQYSLMNLLVRLTGRTIPVGSAVKLDFSATNVMLAAKEYFPLVFKSTLIENIYKVASIIWLSGTILSLLLLIVLYIANKAGTRQAEKIGDGLYRCGHIDNPAVYGIFRPKILLPANVCESHIKYIIAHEKVHIGRCDNLWRMIALLTACVHWFNPLIWLLIKKFFADMELACDTRVARELSMEERKQYAMAMLKYGFKQKSFVPSAFGGSIIRERVENVLSYKALSLFSLLFFSALVITVAAALITNAAV